MINPLVMAGRLLSARETARGKKKENYSFLLSRPDLNLLLIISVQLLVRRVAGYVGGNRFAPTYYRFLRKVFPGERLSRGNVSFK